MNQGLHEKYKMTIGIECHVQLATKTKLFSPADNDANDAKPNSKVHLIDWGLPGMLPRLNKQAVHLAVKAGAALNSKIATHSTFDRKHYFYPDLPKGYQISQMYSPIIGTGYVDVFKEDGEKVKVKIHHAHLEEDAGKLTHSSSGSFVDLNRAGTPLIEIVSEPDIHSAEVARGYAEALYGLMTYAGVTYGDLYRGNMRFDVNISIAPYDSSKLGTRTEVKNLNSFRSVEKSAEYEFYRQAELLEAGEKVIQETRGWDEDTQTTNSQRVKSDAQDYRYMPDADIPPIVLSELEIAELAKDLPLLPYQHREKWQNMKMDHSVVRALLASRKYAEMVTGVLEESGEKNAKRVANWIASSLKTDEGSSGELHAELGDLIELSDMVEQSELSSTNAKDIFNQLVAGERNPRQIAEKNNVLQMNDSDAMRDIVLEVMSEKAGQKAVDNMKAGNEKAIGYIVGQVMKRSAGKANPSEVQKIIKEEIK